MHTSLPRSALKAYLEHLVTLPDLHSPVWFGDRKPSALFVWPCLSPARRRAAGRTGASPAAQSPTAMPRYLVRGRQWLHMAREWSQRCPNHPLLVEGSPGLGKSALLRMLARELALPALAEFPWERVAGTKQGPPTLPIFLPLPLVVRLGSVRAALAEECARSGATDAEALTEYLLEQIAVGRAALLLDALDEVSNADLLGAALAELEGHASLTVITTRPGGRGFLPAWLQPDHHVMDPWRDDEARTFLDAWGATGLWTELLEDGRSLQAVRGSPLLLSLTCATLEPDADVGDSDDPTLELGPPRRTQVYARLFDQVLEGGWQAEQGPAMADWESVLPEVAWRLHAPSPQRNDFSETELYAALAAATGDSGPEIAARQEALMERGIVTPHGGARCAFAHRTFLEYFVALHWRGQLETGRPEEAVALWEMLDRIAGQTEWDEPVRMLAGLLQDPAPLLDRLRDPARDDIARHRLALAALCLGEIGGSPRSLGELTQRRDRIATEYVTLWRHHHRRGTAAVMTRPDVVLQSLCSAGARAGGRLLPEYAVLWAADPADLYPWYSWVSALRNHCVSPEFLSALAGVLRRPEADARRWGIDVVIRLRSAVAADAVALALLDCLHDPDEEYRGEVTAALQSLGRYSGSDRVATRLREEGWNANPSVWPEIVGALLVHAPDQATDLLLELADMATGTDGEARERAIGALFGLCGQDIPGEVIRVLLPRVAQGDTQIGNCLMHLKGIAKSPEFVGELMRASHSECAEGRALAIQVIGALGTAAERHTTREYLVRWLADPVSEVRLAAARIARRAAFRTDEPVCAQLRALRSDADARVVFAAAGAEGLPDPQFLIARLPEFLDHPDPDQRAASRQWLFYLQHCSAPISPTHLLLEGLRKGIAVLDTANMTSICASLPAIGWEHFSGEVVHALVAYLPQFDDWERAREGLFRLPPERRTRSLVHFVEQFLQSPNYGDQARAFDLLSAWGPESVPRLEEHLFAALLSPIEQVTRVAAGAFPVDMVPSTLDRLLDLATHPSAFTRRAVCDACDVFWHPAPPRLIACLVRLLDDPDEAVRHSAAVNIGSLQAQGLRIPAVPV